MSVFLDAENAARSLNAGRLPAFDCKTQNNIFEPDSLESAQRYNSNSKRKPPKHAKAKYGRQYVYHKKEKGDNW